MEKKEKKALIILGIILIILLTLYNRSINADVESCISSGIDANICEELRR